MLETAVVRGRHHGNVGKDELAYEQVDDVQAVKESAGRTQLFVVDVRILAHRGLEFGFSDIGARDEVVIEVADQVSKHDIHEWECLREH